RVLGPMMLRPGLESVHSISAVTRLVPFDRDHATTAMLAFSDQTILVLGPSGTPVQVSAASTAITNPTFTSGGGGWSDVSEMGDGADGTTTLGGSGSVAMLATKWRAAGIQQAVSVGSGDQSTPHTLSITV